MNVTVAKEMVSAEVLRLRRNRGLMSLALVLSVVMTVVVYGYLALQHARNPVIHEVAGGTAGLRRSLRLLGLFFGMLTAALIGTEAGTADISSGVFRDLVATGRSRLALFGVRLPAAILVTWAFTAAGYALGIIATFAFAGGTPTPTLGTVLDGAIWLAAANAVTVTLAVGMGSVSGSRGLTLTAVIGWQTVVTQLLMNVNTLGGLRDWLITPALGELMPLQGNIDGISMATGTAVVVLAVWALVPALLGAWRTRVRDA